MYIITNILISHLMTKIEKREYFLHIWDMLDFFFFIY